MLNVISELSEYVSVIIDENRFLKPNYINYLSQFYTITNGILLKNFSRRFSFQEILEQVTVLNLDTGERVPLSIAEDKLPQCINPLSLHIMRLTSEYVSNSSLEKRKESDEESVGSKKSSATTTDGDTDSVTVIKRATRLKRLLGMTVRRTVSKAKTIAQEVSNVRHKEEMDIRDDVNQQNEPFKLRVSNNHKGPYEFQSLQHVQVCTLCAFGRVRDVSALDHILTLSVVCIRS